MVSQANAGGGIPLIDTTAGTPYCINDEAINPARGRSTYMVRSRSSAEWRILTRRNIDGNTARVVETNVEPEIGSLWNRWTALFGRGPLGRPPYRIFVVPDSEFPSSGGEESGYRTLAAEIQYCGQRRTGTVVPLSLLASRDLRGLIAHELFHAFQKGAANMVEFHGRLNWLAEATAEWGAAPYATEERHGTLDEEFTLEPQAPLNSLAPRLHKYGAFRYFQWLELSGEDMAQLMRSLFNPLSPSSDPITVLNGRLLGGNLGQPLGTTLGRFWSDHLRPERTAAVNGPAVLGELTVITPGYHELPLAATQLAAKIARLVFDDRVKKLSIWTEGTTPDSYLGTLLEEAQANWTGGGETSWGNVTSGCTNHPATPLIDIGEQPSVGFAFTHGLRGSSTATVKILASENPMPQRCSEMAAEAGLPLDANTDLPLSDGQPVSTSGPQPQPQQMPQPQPSDRARPRPERNDRDHLDQRPRSNNQPQPSHDYRPVDQNHHWLPTANRNNRDRGSGPGQLDQTSDQLRRAARRPRSRRRPQPRPRPEEGDRPRPQPSPTPTPNPTPPCPTPSPMPPVPVPPIPPVPDPSPPQPPRPSNPSGQDDTGSRPGWQLPPWNLPTPPSIPGIPGLPNGGDRGRPGQRPTVDNSVIGADLYDLLVHGRQWVRVVRDRGGIHPAPARINIPSGIQPSHPPYFFGVPGGGGVPMPLGLPGVPVSSSSRCRPVPNASQAGCSEAGSCMTQLACQLTPAYCDGARVLLSATKSSA